MRVFAIDPGTTKSGWVSLVNGVPALWGWADNDVLIEKLQTIWGQESTLVIEDIGNYGMAVGRDTFDTCKWMGRFDQAHVTDAIFIPRPTIKTHLCGVASAKDGNVRQALIDRYGGDEIAVGGKKCQRCKGKGWFGPGRPRCDECIDSTGWETAPGPLHGVSGHSWSALAVGVTWLDQQEKTCQGTGR
jgi:hypothetical protein